MNPAPSLKFIKYFQKKDNKHGEYKEGTGLNRREGAG